LSHAPRNKREVTDKRIKTIVNSASIFVYLILKPKLTKWRTPKVSDDVRLRGLWLWTSFRNDS